MNRANPTLAIIEIVVSPVVRHVSRQIVAVRLIRIQVRRSHPVARIILRPTGQWRSARARRGRDRLQEPVAKGVITPAAVVIGVLLRRAGGRVVHRRYKPVQRIVTEAPRAHRGIRITQQIARGVVIAREAVDRARGRRVRVHHLADCVGCNCAIRCVARPMGGNRVGASRQCAG